MSTTDRTQRVSVVGLVLVSLLLGSSVASAAPGNSGSARWLASTEVQGRFPDPVQGDGAVVPRDGDHDSVSELHLDAVPVRLEADHDYLIHLTSDLIVRPPRTSTPQVRGSVEGVFPDGVRWRGRMTGDLDCTDDGCALSLVAHGRLTDAAGEGNCGALTVDLSADLTRGEDRPWTLALADGTGQLALRDRDRCGLTPLEPEPEPDPDPEPEPEPGPEPSVPWTPVWSSSVTVRGDGDNGYMTAGIGGGNPVGDLDGEGVLTCYTVPGETGPTVRVSRVENEQVLATVHNSAAAAEYVLTELSQVGHSRDVCSLARLDDGVLLLLALDAVLPEVRVFVDATGVGDAFVEQEHLAYTAEVQWMSDIPRVSTTTIGIPLVEGERILVPAMLPATGSGGFGWTYPFVLRSDDGGETWTHTQLDTSIYYQSFRGLARFDNGVYAILTNTWGGISTQLWRSVDDGSTWTREVTYDRRFTIDGAGASLFSSGGNDPYNYLVFQINEGLGEADTDPTTLLRVYRLASDASLPLDQRVFSRGTADAPRGPDGDAVWEWIGGPFGDDGFESISVLTSGTVALWGTTHFGGGSQVHAYLGTQPVE